MAEWFKAHAWKACKGLNSSQVRILSFPPNETSARESDGERRAEGAQEEEKGRKRRRVATKAEGDGTEKWAVLSGTAWFVPTFLTKEEISEKLSDEDKKSACFVSKIQLRNSSTQFFLPRSKSFISAFKASVARMALSFCLR